MCQQLREGCPRESSYIGRAWFQRLYNTMWNILHFPLSTFNKKSPINHTYTSRKEILDNTLITLITNAIGEYLVNKVDVLALVRSMSQRIKLHCEGMVPKTIWHYTDVDISLWIHALLLKLDSQGPSSFNHQLISFIHKLLPSCIG